MKKLTLLIAAICCIAFAAPVFAIDTTYPSVGYHESFYRAKMAELKAKGMFVQSRDGRRAAIVPKAQEEKEVEQPTIKVEDEKKSK